MQARLWITILPRSISAAAAGSSSGFAEQRLGSTDHRYIEAPIAVEFVIDVLVDHGKRRYVRAAGTDRGEAVDRQHDQYDRHYGDRADRTGTPECGIVKNHISILPSSRRQTPTEALARRIRVAPSGIRLAPRDLRDACGRQRPFLYRPEFSRSREVGIE